VAVDAGTARDLVALRRDLHHHPEARFAEVRSAGIMAQRLRAAGYAVRTGVGGTGVIGDLHGAQPGPHVLIRADMDALPVQDLKTVAYASSNPGYTHACGHDVHMPVVIATAEQLAR
jgi:amidohydrolase